jgi:hypothetical protein
MSYIDDCHSDGSLEHCGWEAQCVQLLIMIPRAHSAGQFTVYGNLYRASDSTRTGAVNLAGSPYST